MANKSGFYIVECSCCGEVSAFCSKVGVDKYRCRHCDGVTYLNNQRQANVLCECGHFAKYRVFAKSDLIEINCIKCGSPVALERNQFGNYRSCLMNERKKEKRHGRK